MRKYTTKIVEKNKKRKEKTYTKKPKRNSMLRNKSTSIKVSKFER